MAARWATDMRLAFRRWLVVVAGAWLAVSSAGCSQSRGQGSGSVESPPVAEASPPPAPVSAHTPTPILHTSQSPAPEGYVNVEELPEAITRVPPEYPEEARKAKAEGTVQVQALVGADGLVQQVKILSSPSPLLNPAASDAVRKWVFKPAMAHGKPVAVWVTIPVRFTLH